MTFAGRFAGGALAVALLAGCSIQSDSAPRLITDEDQSALRAPQPEPAGAPTSGNERIYLVAADGSGRLRTVAREPTGPLAEGLLQLLFDGANDAEERQALLSAIPDVATLNDVTVRDNIVTVDIGDELLGLPSAQLVLAVAQIVYTASQVVDNAQVVIRVNGSRQSWPDVSRRQLSRPLTIYDFNGLAENAQPAYPAQVAPVATVPPATTAAATTTSAPLAPSPSATAPDER